MSFVDHEDVLLARSPISHRTTERPRPAASRATPHPLMPPPITMRSTTRSKDALPPLALFGSEYVFFSVRTKASRKQVARQYATLAAPLGVFVSVAVRQSLDDGDTPFSADVADARIPDIVGDPSLNLADVGDANGRRPLELRTVGDQDGVAGILQDGLSHLDLSIVEIEERSVGFDRRGADDGMIHLELAYEFARRGADDGSVRASHRAAGDNHFNARALIEKHRHVYVVGDDEEVFVARETLGDLLGRRADVDEQGAAVGNEGGGRKTNSPLLRRGYETTRFIGDIFDARGNNRAAMHARQKVAVAEVVQIFPDRLGGNFISPGEVLDADPSRDPRERDNLCLACRKIVHHVDLTGWSTVSSVAGDNTGSGARAGSLEIDARDGSKPTGVAADGSFRHGPRPRLRGQEGASNTPRENRLCFRARWLTGRHGRIICPPSRIRSGSRRHCERMGLFAFCGFSARAGLHRTPSRFWPAALWLLEGSAAEMEN